MIWRMSNAERVRAYKALLPYSTPKRQRDLKLKIRQLERLSGNSGVSL